MEQTVSNEADPVEVARDAPVDSADWGRRPTAWSRVCPLPGADG